MKNKDTLKSRPHFLSLSTWTLVWTSHKQSPMVNPL